jgi:hypothetical protein
VERENSEDHPRCRIYDRAVQDKVSSFADSIFEEAKWAERRLFKRDSTEHKQVFQRRNRAAPCDSDGTTTLGGHSFFQRKIYPCNAEGILRVL